MCVCVCVRVRVIVMEGGGGWCKAEQQREGGKTPHHIFT